MPPNPIPTASWEIHQAMFQQYAQGGGPSAVITLLMRLLVEVEALREALSHPETPEAVRRSYRAAYERTAVLSHNSAGVSGGMEKILECFLASRHPKEPSAPELQMMDRLGATEEEKRELCARMDLAETFT